MIHIVTAANRCLFEDEILEFRRIDCANSVCAVTWKGDDLASGIDHLDNDDAIHILAIEDGRVYGASRLTPSSKPHRLGDIFPHLAAMRGVPRDPAVYEWTPGPSDPLSAPDAQADDRHRHVVGTLMCAVVEYCLAEGIDALSGIIDAWSLPRFHDMGWTIQPLGLPEQVGQEWVLAVLMPIDASVLEATRAFYGIDEQVLLHQGPHPSITREITL
jgi:acyl-homoserine lactone synthase